MQLEEILENFEFLDEWEDKYRYVIDLGRAMPEFPDEDRIDLNKVEGCVSQVWLTREVEDGKQDPIIGLKGDSDAHIVRGLVALVLTAFSGKKASEIASFDTEAMFSRIGLKEHLTPQRSNGLNAMVNKIKSDAAKILNEPANA